MQERVLAIGGNFQMRTSPGRGVIVRAMYIQPAVGAIEEMGQDRRSAVFM